MINDRELLKILRTMIEKKLGSIVKSVILFGSRVKGNSRADSDYDILVIVTTTASWDIEQSILDICYDLEIEHEIFIDLSVLAESDLSSPRGRQPFVADAFASGISS